HPARQAEPLAPSSQQPAPAFSPSQFQTTSPSNEKKIMVAPEDSAVHVKEKARFICSGRHDENQIMAAINLLGSRPGIVELQAGTFHCSGTLILPPGITLQGGGPDKTILQFEEPDQMVSILINQPGITLRNLSVTGHGSIRISASHTKLEGIGSRSDLPQKDPNSISRTAAFEVLGSVMPVRDVSFLNCSASGADRDGFALKCVTPALNLTNITLEGCRTIDCGLSVNGAGYLVSRVQNVTFKNCTDEGSFIGWIIENQSGQITIADSISTSNRQWALCLSNSHHLSITGFHQIDQPGASGSQSMNGNPGEAAAVSSPVTDSTFELIGQGKSKLPLINEAGDRNRYSLIQKP
ncbi:MAG TPA: hypothetical protein PKM25_11920, partial [Candidatus Ozemobacteraceae bacterium]|nr:hypothetical protein [Candidatus Ozemobacteraceae bacterium]